MHSRCDVLSARAELLVKSSTTHYENWHIVDYIQDLASKLL